MAGSTVRARKRLARGNYVVPSPKDIDAARTKAGGWSAATLATWGVPWPPPIGWRERLEAEWRAINPTLFDDLH